MGALAGCHASVPLAAPAAPLTQPEILCTDAEPTVECNRAEQIEAWLRDPRLVIVGSAPTGGTQGASILTVAVPRVESRIVLRARWRPLSSQSLTNDPRKELGAYAVQKLFLEPHEYVVPPTTGHCFALEHYRGAVDRDATPSFEEEGGRCVFGILSYWLENVNNPKGARKAGLWSEDGILDEKLFEQNVGYGKSIADLNLLTYLIHHGDSHDQQFLISKDRLRPHVYSVDNSIAFQSIKNPMLLFRTDWSNIQVPAVSRRSIARLRSLAEESWERLAVIEQYRARGADLVPEPPATIIGPRDAGLRRVGLGLQIGLTDAEIRGVRDRLSLLISDIDDGDVRTF
jgi:hypothetical protein